MFTKSPVVDKLKDTFHTQITTEICSDLLKQAKTLHINLDTIIEDAVKNQCSTEEIEQKITRACNTRLCLIYNNLIDNYPIPHRGIRDCYKKSM